MSVSSKKSRRKKPERVAVRKLELVNLWQWQLANEHLFPTPVALRWHLDRHRERYEQAGALFMLGGRFVIDPAKFEAVTLEIGRQQAIERRVRGREAMAAV